jgi:hypothetical protein
MEITRRPGKHTPAFRAFGTGRDIRSLALAAPYQSEPCGQPIAVGVVWERGRAFVSLRRALPPVRPRIRAHNAAGRARHARAEPGKAIGRASDRRSAPLRGGRSVGRGSARANRREHDLLRLVRRAVRRIRESASSSNEGKWSNGTCWVAAARRHLNLEHSLRAGCTTLKRSGAAKGFAHDLIGSRWIGVSRKRWLILVRRGNHRQQPFET